MSDEYHGFAAAAQQFNNPYHDSILPEELAEAADEIIPDFFSHREERGTKYREHILLEYKNRTGIPLRRADNGENRSRDQTRLDRAWQDVAQRMDRDPNTIRGCVLSVYDDPGEYEDKPARLRADFNEIIERAGEDNPRDDNNGIER